MLQNHSSQINKPYVFGVLALILLFPILSLIIESFLNSHISVSFEVIGKWVIFYASGIRLFLAGIRQISNPAFTAKDIFLIEDTSCYPIVRELGFANLCAGLVGIISLVIPHWRIVSAFSSGLYYGIAGLNHYLKKPAGANELFALITDVIVFLVLFAYVLFFFG